MTRKSMTGREALRLLQQAGWRVLRQHRGDHYLLLSPSGQHRVSVPYMSDTLGTQLSHQIWRALRKEQQC